MKFDELSARVNDRFPNPEYLLTWYTGEYFEADNAVVPLSDGRFTLYHASGRGGFTEEFDSEGQPRIWALP